LEKPVEEEVIDMTTTDEEILFKWSSIKARIFSEIQGTPRNNEDEKLAAIRLWRMAEKEQNKTNNEYIDQLMRLTKMQYEKEIAEARASGKKEGQAELIEKIRKAIIEHMKIEWGSYRYSKYDHENAVELADEIIQEASESASKKGDG
jgi:hypothetical protein